MPAATRITDNIAAAVANLRVEILRSVPMMQQRGALNALAVLEGDLARAIHTNTETE